MFRRVLLLGLLTAALTFAFAPIPEHLVERWYSNGIYPPIQRVLTTLSNRVPFALFDTAILVLAGVALWLLIRDFRRKPRWGQLAWRWLMRVVTTAVTVYVVFQLTWGLNYRRVALAQKVDRAPAAPPADSARQLALSAVKEANSLYDSAHATEAFNRLGIDQPLARAFMESQKLLGLSPAVPARPKHTLLDLYFRAASVAGMTDPFFLESFIASDLLQFERPFVIAHEWSHLAGINDEGEANFLGWLTAIRGSEIARYSGWLFLYSEVLPSLPRADRAEVARQLGPGPRADLRAIADRQRRNVKPAVANAGWRVYDSYLRANRVEAGARSYAQVVQLILQTRFDPDWTPVLRRQ